MTLQRAIGAVILLVIFLMIAILLLVENKSEPEAMRISLLALTTPVATETPHVEVVTESTPAPVEQVVVAAAAQPLDVTTLAPHETAQQWLLQIGTFSKQENALNLVEKLKQNGITALADSVTSLKGTLYRVRTVPQIDKPAVEKLGVTIEELINIAPQVRRYNG